MANQFSDQFNFDPADNKETSASYTVPIGKYAIMSVTMSVDAYGEIVSAFANIEGIGVTSNSNSIQMELRLKEGSVVTKIETGASGSNTTPIGVTTINGTSIAQVLVDSVVVGTVRCTASAYVSDSSSDARSVSVFGNADVDWHISEYNKQGV